MPFPYINCTFTRAKVMTINMGNDLVIGVIQVRIVEGNGGKIGPLVNVLIKVLHNLNGTGNLDIDVRIVLPGEVGVVWDNMAIV